MREGKFLKILGKILGKENAFVIFKKFFLNLFLKKRKILLTNLLGYAIIYIPKRER